MVKTYLPAPNFSTAPPPAGPVDLGHILTDLNEFTPLNRHSRVAVPESDLLPPDEKRQFRASRAELQTSNVGVFAQFLAVCGVGVDVAGTYERASEDVLSVDRLVTLAFDPTESYIRESLQAALPVRMYLQDSSYKKPLYMVTGLKIAQGASMETKTSRTRGGKLRVGLSYPGVPVQAGPDVEASRKIVSGLQFEGSSDFVVAFRVQKIKYKLKGNRVVHKTFVKGATMMDGEDAADETDDPHVLELEDDLTTEDLNLPFLPIAVQDIDRSGENIVWLVPEECSRSRT